MLIISICLISETLVLSGLDISELGCGKEDSSDDSESGESGMGKLVEVLLFHNVSLPVTPYVLNKLY